jgi:hypothetical protein
VNIRQRDALPDAKSFEPRGQGRTVMLTIWGRKTSVNVQKVMWAVAELNLAHERIDAGGTFGKLDTADYGALNPNRLVPTSHCLCDPVWFSD